MAAKQDTCAAAFLKQFDHRTPRRLFRSPERGRYLGVTLMKSTFAQRHVRRPFHKPRRFESLEERLALATHIGTGGCPLGESEHWSV